MQNQSICTMPNYARPWLTWWTEITPTFWSLWCKCSKYIFTCRTQDLSNSIGCVDSFAMRQNCFLFVFVCFVLFGGDFFLFSFVFTIPCVWLFWLHVCLCTSLSASCPQKPEVGARFPELELLMGCEPPAWCWESRSSGKAASAQSWPLSHLCIARIVILRWERELTA